MECSYYYRYGAFVDLVPDLAWKVGEARGAEKRCQ